MTTRNVLWLTSVLALCIVLGACNDTPQPIPAPEPVVDIAVELPSDPEPTDPWDFTDAPRRDTRITVSPNPVDFCIESLQAVDVEWDLAAANARSPQIWVQEPNGRRQLWAALKEPTGGKRTGNWTRTGTQFLAIDHSTLEVLNSVTVEAKSCP